MYKKFFSERIRMARLKYDLTQEDVARETGIPRSHISKYEQGKLEPTLENLGKLSNFYRVSIDWLLGLGMSTSESEHEQKMKEVRDRSNIMKDTEKEAKRLSRMII